MESVVKIMWLLGLCYMVCVADAFVLLDGKTPDPCQLKGDGKYCTSNSFQYMVCKNHTASYVSCGENIYDPTTKTCVAPTKFNETNYCKNRPNGDYNWPWNCHRYVICSNHYFYLLNCSTPDLVFDPSKDACEHPDKVKCKEVKVKVTKAKDPCETKADGKYCTSDSFEYMVCKGHVASYVSCGENLYDPATQKCVDPSKFDARNYCRDRPNGDYNWPWDCHKYVTCSNHYFYPFNCSTPDLVFDPKKDKCEHPDKVKCKEIKGLRNKNLCTGLPDGQYSFGNVFQYVTCTKGEPTYTKCEAHNIYDPALKKCDSVAHYNVQNFCADRSTGNFQNPWNCHGYIACVYKRPYLMKCQFPDLVYNPELDMCVEAAKYQCREEKARTTPKPTSTTTQKPKSTTTQKPKSTTTQKPKSTTTQRPVVTKRPELTKKNATNPCETKPDGKYGIRDIYRYLECTNKTSRYVTCDAQIFDPPSKTCVDYSTVSRDNFCKGRVNSNYNDPWNCHKFITCSNGNIYFFNCSTADLVYDPMSDTCKHPEEAACKQINDPCSLKPDGKYSTRDVFQYMICKDGVSSFVSCGTNLYDACAQKCVDPSVVTKGNLCKCRTNNNYMNPWDCHKYVTCSNHNYYLFNCSTPDLIYDPTKDQCEHPDKVKCRQVKSSLTTSRNGGHITFKRKSVEERCLPSTVGFYAVRDVTKVLLCVFGKSFYMDCSPNSIYIPGRKSCTPLKHMKLDEFCRSRGNGNWANPLDVTSYVTCYDGTMELKTCPGRLVYNPSLDVCQNHIEDGTEQYERRRISRERDEGNIQIVIT